MSIKHRNVGSAGNVRTKPEPLPPDPNVRLITTDPPRKSQWEHDVAELFAKVGMQETIPPRPTTGRLKQKLWDRRYGTGDA